MGLWAGIADPSALVIQEADIAQVRFSRVRELFDESGVKIRLREQRDQAAHVRGWGRWSHRVSIASHRIAVQVIGD